MKGFIRKNQCLSLCGLNCLLCPMYIGSYCPGCGGGEGNQSCKIAKCSLENGNVEYCCQCTKYPCDKYEHIDEADSFITHQNQKNNLDLILKIGEEAYNIEQKEKQKLLEFFLLNCNDGRRKNLFCLGVNLLDLQSVKSIEEKIKNSPDFDNMPIKERAEIACKELKKAAEEKEIELKLRKKTN